MASKAVKVARAKFDKLAALNADIAVGGHIGMAARRTKAKLADVWTKRTTRNVQGFYDQKLARAMKRGAA